jgi:hypothetical protein
VPQRGIRRSHRIGSIVGTDEEASLPQRSKFVRCAEVAQHVLLTSPMNVRDGLHRRVDGLDVRDAKRRLHVLVAELDEETARQIPDAGGRSPWRRSLKEWGFRM